MTNTYIDINYEKQEYKALLVGSSKGYVLATIATKLEEHEVKHIYAKDDVNEVSHLKYKFNAALIQLDDNILRNQKFLIYLRDLVLEQDMPIFLLGYPSEIDEAKEILPEHLIQGSFARPIDGEYMADKMATFIKSHDSRHRKKILVVDDSGHALRMIKGWLEDKYQVALANSGMMAIKSIVQDRPDLMLLDYEMPIVDGKQVLEMIRSEADTSDLPVIFLTSKNDKNTIMGVMNLRPEGYLLKTMDPKLIVQTIDNFFEKNKSKLT